MNNLIYYIYHIPGKKIGVTTNVRGRVEDQQGYGPGEYEILGNYTDIQAASDRELFYQRLYGYRVDETPYNKLNFNQNKNKMNINITEATTTFPCPVNKLKGRLMDNINMSWETEHGDCKITLESIKWIMERVQISKYNDERCYIYNKAFARYFDNNDAYKNNIITTLTGGLAPTGPRTTEVPYSPEKENFECCDEDSPCQCQEKPSRFDLIREWAEDRGIYDHGDPKTQTLKLVEEVGEIARAVLKDDKEQIIDGIGDCVVVLTNLAELCEIDIEDCIDEAYDVISGRTGEMVNGTFQKD